MARTQYPTVTLEDIAYQYIKTSDKYYFGWEEASLDGRTSKIATAEKALIDLVQFHRTRLDVNLVAEKLAVYRDDLDMARLQAFLLRSNLATLRIFGLMLDQLEIDTWALWEVSRHSTTASRLTASSELHDSRWRLYYDDAALAPLATNA